MPWLFLLRGLKGRAAFRWSWLIGFLFFLGSMWWLLQLTTFGGPAAILGWVVLCAYLALYFGAFGWFVRWFQGTTLVHSPQSTVHKRASSLPACAAQGGGKPPVFGAAGRQPPASSLFVVPAAWTALEYARSHVFTGLGWNLLAYSQTAWLPVIQAADITGAWGVSFLIVLVNVTLSELLDSRFPDARRTTHDARQRTYQSIIWTCVAVLVAVGYGVWRLSHVGGGETTRVAVVQGNIPQTEKWDESKHDEILQRYETLTREAAKTRPDLIVWPETSVPGFLDLDEDITQRLFTLASTVQLPMLVGSPRTQLDGLVWRMTNGAALLEGNEVVRWYDKLHLVPFGEFIPFEHQLPWLRRVMPPIGEFVPGRTYTVFQTPVASDEWRVASRASSLVTGHSSLDFSVLICFEDVFPELARRFVRNGARLLLVITNDAWFGPTAAAYQHVQASTFRAVELRVPLARAANTGWSGCIDASGRRLGSVHDGSGNELFVSGTQTCDLPTGAANSLYLKWGDWFALLCLVVTLGAGGYQIRQVTGDR